MTEGTIAGGNVSDNFTYDEETEDEEISGEEADEQSENDLKNVEEKLMLRVSNEQCERS